MVDVLTYKATKVYTPQTNEWASLAKDVQAFGKGVADTLKGLGKTAEAQEKKESKQAKENERLATQARSQVDKVEEARADNRAIEYEIALTRQTQAINAQYKDNPTSPEKEAQIRAVGKDLQEQMSANMSPVMKNRFLTQTEKKTNEYVLSTIKADMKDMVKDADETMGAGITTSIADAKNYAKMQDYDAIASTYKEQRASLENFLAGTMPKEQQDLALRAFDRRYITGVFEGISEVSPDLAREFKNNPAAVAQVLAGGDYLTELALRSELNKGIEQIDGMEFAKNGRYQKEKQQAKLVNSLGLVELEYDDGGQKALTLSSQNISPALTTYTAELMGGATGKDLDYMIKQADNVQKGKLAQAKYDGAVQSIFTTSYNNLEQIKNSDLYKNGDEYTVGLAERYEKMLNDRREALNNAMKMTDEDLRVAYDDFNKALEKIDGKSINPVIDAYTQLSRIQAALSVRDGRDNDKDSDDLQQAFQNAVIDKDFRSGLTQTIRNHWTPPVRRFSGELARDTTTFANRVQEVETIKAENEAIAGFLALAGQGRLDDARQFYVDKRNSFYDNIYANWIDIDSVLNAWKEGKRANVQIGNAMYTAVERDADGQILFEPLMTKVKY